MLEKESFLREFHLVAADATSLLHLKLLEKHENKEYLYLVKMQRWCERDKIHTHLTT